MGLDELETDLEYQQITPMMKDAEFDLLEKNIVEDGRVNEPLVLWDGVLVDGYNRYRVLQKHPDIPFTTVDRTFENRYAALAWICRVHLGRRNMSQEEWRYLVGKQYENEKMANGFNIRYDTDGKKRLGQNDPAADHGTRSRIAREIGKSESYVKRAHRAALAVDAADEACPGFEKEYRAGNIKASDDELATVLRASPKDRPELVAELKKPPGERRKITLPILKEKIMPERVYVSPGELKASDMQTQTCISGSPPPADSPGLSDILKEAGVKGITDNPSENPNKENARQADADKPIEESILRSMHLAVVHLMESFNNYFYRFPALLEDPRYRNRSVAVVKEFETYIYQIEKGVQENETAEQRSHEESRHQ